MFVSFESIFLFFIIFYCAFIFYFHVSCENYGIMLSLLNSIFLFSTECTFGFSAEKNEILKWHRGRSSCFISPDTRQTLIWASDYVWAFFLFLFLSVNLCSFTTSLCLPYGETRLLRWLLCKLEQVTYNFIFELVFSSYFCSV